MHVEAVEALRDTQKSRVDMATPTTSENVGWYARSSRRKSTPRASAPLMGGARQSREIRRRKGRSAKSGYEDSVTMPAHRGIAFDARK
jgi:hypothetical protein